MLTLPASIRPMTLLLCLNTQYMQACRLLREFAHVFIDPTTMRELSFMEKEAACYHSFISTWSHLFLHEMTNAVLIVIKFPERKELIIIL